MPKQSVFTEPAPKSGHHTRPVDELGPDDRRTRDLVKGDRVRVIPSLVRTVARIEHNARTIGDRSDTAIHWEGDAEPWFEDPATVHRLVDDAWQADEWNRTVDLLRALNTDERPAIRVGDALVFAYWEGDTLRVSIDTSGVEDRLAGKDGCKLRVDVENGTVHTRGVKR